jgi:hypothetical protein
MEPSENTNAQVLERGATGIWLGKEKRGGMNRDWGRVGFCCGVRRKKCLRIGCVIEINPNSRNCYWGWRVRTEKNKKMIIVV